MDPTYSAEAEAYRKTVRALLDEYLPADWSGIESLPPEEQDPWLERWRAVLAEHQLLAPSWPTEYGGAGLSPIERVVLHEEFTRSGAPTGIPTDVLSIGLLGPTLILCGTEEQKRCYLPRILSGEDRWCQGCSEPDAGSDLAGLGTRAELDGDEWVINGQKIWTSHGHRANWAFGGPGDPGRGPSVLGATDPQRRTGQRRARGRRLDQQDPVDRALSGPHPCRCRAARPVGNRPWWGDDACAAAPGRHRRYPARDLGQPPALLAPRQFVFRVERDSAQHHRRTGPRPAARAPSERS